MARDWIYAQQVKGRFQRMHRISSIFLHLILFVVPWIPIAGHPMVHIDLPDRRVYVLGTIFTATDGLLLVLMLLLAAFSLFFFTSLFGRLWCGFLCPQTVFLEEWARRIEDLVEGRRNVRMKRDNAPLSFDRVWRKGVKWFLFGVVAFVVSMAFQSFFATPWALWTGQAGPVDYTLVGLFTVGWFLDFAWFREQFCIYLCPYARFQGALTDEHSLVVSYDAIAAEPRGGKAAKADGRCLDCDKCVIVCPQGIDIRDGFQLECITCGRCIDACEETQGKFGNVPNIRYTTIAAEQGKKAKWVRPRTVVYASLLTAIAAAFVGIVIMHSPMEAYLQRMPGAMYSVDDDGFVRNTYLLKVTNNGMGDDDTAFRVQVEGLPDADVRVSDLAIAPRKSETIPLIVRVPPDTAHRTQPFVVTVRSENDSVRLEAIFKGPGNT